MSSAQVGAPSARSLFNSILRGSSLYSIALVTPLVASIAVVPVMTRFLSRAEYGILSLLEQISWILSMLLGTSFSVGLGYFYFQGDAEGSRRTVAGTAIVGAAALGAAAGLICWPLTKPIQHLFFPHTAVEGYLRLLFVGMLPSFVLEALLAWLRVVNRPGAFVFAALFRAAVSITGVVVLVGMLRWRIWGMMYTNLGAGALTAAILAVVWFHLGRSAPDISVFFRMARFAVPVGLSGISMFVLNFGDRFILPRYRGFEDLAIYVLAYKIGMLMSVVYGSFHTYWAAQVVQIMRRDDAGVVFARLCTYMILAVSFCALGLIVCSKPAVRVMAPPVYQGAAALVPIIAISYAVRSVGDFFRCLFLAKGRPEYDAICAWVATVFSLAAYFALIPKFGIWGAAAATLLAFLILTVLTLVWTYRLIPYRVEPVRLFKIGIATAGTAMPYAFVPVPTLVAQIAWAALLLMAFPAILWLLRFATPGEVQTGRQTLQWLGRLISATSPEARA